jgi:hypothetical protein
MRALLIIRAVRVWLSLRRPASCPMDASRQTVRRLSKLSQLAHSYARLFCCARHGSVEGRPDPAAQAHCRVSTVHVLPSMVSNNTDCVQVHSRAQGGGGHPAGARGSQGLYLGSVGLQTGIPSESAESIVFSWMAVVACYSAACLSWLRVDRTMLS